MKINIGHAGEKKIGFDLDTLLTTRLLIQANSGAGKSWLLRRLMEELFGHVQVIAIDPEGEFATLREKFDYVLVGKGGETPAHVSTAEELAHKLLELRASAVCDLYEMPARERHAWVAKFLSALIDAPKKLWHPVVIIIDEAQMFCPEKGESEAASPMIDLTTRGRKRGFCAVWATQRLAEVNKSATSMLLNRLVGGTFEDVDIKRALDLLSIPPEDKHEVAARLKVLDPGWFYAFGRAISKERLLFKVGEVQTSHPKPGSAKHAAEPPEPSEKIRGMLAQLAELPKVAEEKARTIEDYKRQVRELTGQVAQMKRTLTTQTKTQIAAAVNEVHPRVIATALKKRDDEWKRAIATSSRERERFIIAALQTASANVIANMPALTFPKEITDVAIAAGGGGQSAGSVASTSRPAAADIRGGGRAQSDVSKPMEAVNGQGSLSGPQKRILAALAMMHALGRNSVLKSTVAVLAGASFTSSSFTNNLGSLRTAGLIDYPSGGEAALTQSGFKEAPIIDPPASAEEMLQRCKELVSVPQGRILDELGKVYPRELEKDMLADLAGASSTSSSYTNNLGFLRSAGMIDYPTKGTARLEPWVMMEE